MPAKRSSINKKLRKRKALASRIERTGFEMFPCSSCDKNNTKCVVLDKENSGRYSKCVLRRAKCDVEGILVGEWRLLKLETNRLERKRQAALAALEAAHRSALESASRIRRLEKQQSFLKSKGKDMVCRGLKTMDKLDEAEDKERQIGLRQAATATMPSNSPTPCALVLGVETNPFASLEVLLLPPKV
jgi:hypothetical protein